MKRCLNCMEEYEEQHTVCPFCGWDGGGEPGEWLEPGSILQGRYIIGTVRSKKPADLLYIGWDALFSRKVLVEEYFPRSRVRRDGGRKVKPLKAEDEDWTAGKKLFVDDARTLITLDGTKGLLDVFSVVEENDTAYMVMEYPGERTLRDVLVNDPPWSLEQTERLLMDLSWCLMAAHRNGVVHGQLCMEYCYAVRDGEYKVGCFNEAGFLTGDIADRNAGPLGPNVDIFELAHIAGAALCGVDRWEKRSVDENLDDLSEEIPEYVIDTLADAMNTDPGCWPESLRRFLDRFMDEATIEMPSNRVLDEEELPGRPQSLWKKIFN